ncbi:MAG: hypothetical protein IKD43_02790, partial [Clostridia bacterium]|nr:hypothetical protein [Clostridia bacterium]
MNGSKKIKTGKVSMAWSVVMKFIATLSALVILAIGGHTALSLLKEGEGLTVDLGYGSAIHEVEEGARFSLENAEAFYDVDDESAPETHFDAHGANKRVGIFARINWQIKQEKHWYSEMFSTVNTIVAQEVESYRQFEDGHLIATDITKSSLINGADQFCYFIDEKSEDLGLVVWRKPVGGASTWSGLDTEWQTGDPYSSMTIADYKKENGLPAYEMSVYVIRNDTVLSSSEVTLTEDHLYSITYQLNPAIWQDENGDNRGATSYYANQMAFSSGGIVDPQTLEFESIEVTFEFDEAFQVQRVHIEESYAAMYGPIPAPCTAISDTTYSYERDKAHSNAYQDYFEAYEDSKATGGGVKEPTPMDALLSMALGLLEEPTSLKLDLMMGDTPQSGALWIDPSRLDLTDLDLSNLDITALLGQLDLRLQLSDINLWLESCTAYLEYGGIRGALLLNELIGLIEDFTASDEVEAQSEDGADLLSAIINGVFTYGEGQASLLCELPLLGTTVHADFYFLLNEENEASLDRIELSLTANGTPIEGQIAFGEEIPPALEEAQKGAFIELLPYAENLIDLFQSQALHTEIAYMGDAFALEAALEIGLKPFSVGGTLTVTQTKSGSKKSVSFFHLEGDIYVDLDGVKVKVNLAEAAAFLLEYIAIPTESECALDLESLVHVILDPAFAENFAVSEAENELLIVLRGTELLEALGVKFDLGEVSIGASAGRLTASVLGLTAVVTPGTPYGTDDPKQYVEILPYVQGIVDLLGKENLAIQLTYGEDGEDWHVSAHLNFNLKTLALSGTADVSYRGTCKRITIVYGEGVIFLTLDGIKLSADIERAVTLISSFVAGDALPVGEVDAIEQLLSVNFGEFISLGESEKTLTAILKGSALMKAFGIDFELDEVNLCLTKEGTITAEAQGVTVEITEGKAPEAVDPEEYIAIIPYAEAVYELIESGYLAASVSYEAAKLALAGEAVIDLKKLTVSAELWVTYGEASKKLELVYAEEAVYVSVEGMRIKASVAELAGFIARFAEIPETDVEANELLESVLQLDLSMLVTITEADDTLSLALAGNELLKL